MLFSLLLLWWSCFPPQQKPAPLVQALWEPLASSHWSASSPRTSRATPAKMCSPWRYCSFWCAQSPLWGGRTCSATRWGSGIVKPVAPCCTFSRWATNLDVSSLLAEHQNQACQNLFTYACDSYEGPCDGIWARQIPPNLRRWCPQALLMALRVSGRLMPPAVFKYLPSRHLSVSLTRAVGQTTSAAFLKVSGVYPFRPVWWSQSVVTV